MKRSAFTILFFLILSNSFAQINLPLPNSRVKKNTNPQPQNPNNPNAIKDTGPRKDSLNFERRADYDAKDSIVISFRYIDSTRRNPLDSGINDFDKYFPTPASWQNLGNNGAAAFPLIFQTYSKPGWDAGYHAFDLYRYSFENTKLYKTTRPFTSLGYQIASGKEQMVKVTHTQNPSQNMNVGFDYNLITAPGFFISQKNNHSSYRFFGNYQGRRKRYNASLVILGNKIRSAQNGGIQSDTFLLNPYYQQRYSIPVNMGNSEKYDNNPFFTSVNTGNTYKDFSFFIRQSYDLGKRDSIEVNDSTTEYLFYPKLRLQYSLTTNSYNYLFSDVWPDSLVYRQWYNLTIDKPKDTFSRRERWKVLNNDFSLIQFPDTKNTAQFVLAGITMQTIKGELQTGEIADYNIILHGEYRNRTRNKKWDVLLKGEFYLNGFNGGDYGVEASLSRYLNKTFGNISLYFNNVNRTPSFVFDNRSSFNFGNNNNFNKENITIIGATATNPFLTFGFKNYLINNYSYFSDYYHTKQYSKPVSLLQLFVSKNIRLGRAWHYYLDATLQQTDGANPVKVPLLYTRSRIAYEGKLSKNLKLSTGVEVRYYTAYKANTYSPILGQFVPQDSITVNNLPDISLFVHFRIKGFTGYVRGENLNTVSFKDGFGFVNNNFAAPHYPTPGFIFRFGIQWWYVN
jgi:hypothetical protein